MLKVSFWVEVAIQQAGCWRAITTETAKEMIEKVPSLLYEEYGIDPFGYELEQDDDTICEGTYEVIIKKLKDMELNKVTT